MGEVSTNINIVFHFCHVAVFLTIKYILFKNSPMQPFEFVIIFNMTTCFGKMKFPSSGPRYTVHSVV
jgi:hypothetical protein